MHKGLIILILTIVFAISGVFAQTPVNKFLVKGYAFTNFEKEEEGISNFEAAFNPIFLWKHGDKLFFEGEFEMELGEEGLDIGLEYTQIFYFFNDYITFGAGKFLNPINVFVERLHPTWINKLPDKPLGMSLLASSQLGFQFRGGIPLGAKKLTYAFFVSNGPIINTQETPIVEESINAGVGNGGVITPQDAGGGASGIGTLNYNNFHDNNENKAIGGRIGFYLLPQLEIGYGFQTAKVGDKGSEFEDLTATNQVVDFSFLSDIEALKGKVDIRAQWAWLNIDNPGIHPLEFENKSKGGYAQIAFQPNGVENEFFKNLEFVFRADRLDLPEEAPLNLDRDRLSFGLNYWVSPSSAFKFAFETMTIKNPQGDEDKETKIIAQFTLGF